MPDLPRWPSRSRPRSAVEVDEEFPDPALVPRGGGPLPTDADPLGFEVVGLDWGTAHSWHCHDYVDDASAALGVRPRTDGLLECEDDARAVVEWMSALPADEAPAPAPWTVLAVHAVRG